MFKIRWSRNRLIFNPIPGKDGLYIETGPWTPRNKPQLHTEQNRNILFQENASKYAVYKTFC